MVKKSEGFKGQRSIILPRTIVSEIKETTVGRQLFLTDIGFYPNAASHYRERQDGCDQFILIYCTGGKGWISVSGRRYRVENNMYFIIPPKVPHSYGSDENDPWSIYWLHFSGEMAGHFYDISGRAGTIAPSPVSRIEDRIMLFEEIMANLEMGYSRENLEYANVCLLHFLSTFKYISQFRQVRKIKEHDVVEKAILFMRKNVGKKLLLADIANEAGLSASHFSLLFRKKTGHAPMDYLIHLKMQKACQLLDSTSKRVKEVSALTGYDDQYYFSRIFKKVMGISPDKYRREPKG